MLKHGNNSTQSCSGHTLCTAKKAKQTTIVCIFASTGSKSCDAAVGRGGHGTEVPIEVLEVAGHSNHGGIVRRIAEGRDEDFPAVTAGVVVEGIAQACICRDTAGDGHLLYLQVAGGEAELLHQNIDDGLFERSGKVALVVFDEVRVVLQPVAQTIEEACLQSAEAVVVAWDVWFGKGEGVGIALAGKLVDDGTSRIAQSHNLGAFVDGFASSIVDGLADDFHVLIALDKHYLAVAAADQKAEEWEGKPLSISPEGE